MIENRSYSKDKNKEEKRKHIIPIQISSSEVPFPKQFRYKRRYMQDA